LLYYQDKEALQAVIYSISYVRSYVKNSGTKGNGEFNGFNNNFGGISLYINWSPTTEFFLKQYSCINVKGSGLPNGTSEPLVGFIDLDSYIKFMAARLEKNVPRILDPAQTSGGLPQYYVCNWPKENVSVSYYQSNLSLYTEVRNTFKEALQSCVDVKIIKEVTRKELVAELKKVTEKIKQIGVTPTPSPVLVQPGQVCPPATITTFSPLVANKDTILQINGTNLDTVTEIVLINQTIKVKDNKDVTILNNETIRLTVPQVGTGVLAEGKIKLVSNGEYLTTTLFKYDPSITAAAAASPGGYAGNNQTSVVSPSMNSNTNPQNTAPVTLVSKYEAKSPPDVTDKLTVSVNPNAGTWDIKKFVKMTVSVFDRKVVNNNTTQTLKTTVETTLSNYVVNNIFTITHDNIKTLLFDTPIVPFNKTPIKPDEVVSIQFVITADAVDKVKYPQPTIQSFNFVYNKPVTDSPLSPAALLASVLNAQPGSLIKVGETFSGGLPDYNGTSYYNVKKPAGGYITFRFVCPNLLTIKSPNVVAIPSLDDTTIVITNGTDTKYTNVIEVKNIGAFQMSVDYTSSDLKWTNPNTQQVELITGTATSPSFTL
jgi:hypothetical protein